MYSSIKFGGCVIYAKSIHKTELVTPLTKTTNSCDHIYVKMPKFSGNKPLLVGCYYRFCRTSKDDVMNFINVFENNLDSNIIKNNKTLIAGDFNLDLTAREGVHSNRSSVYDLFIPRVNLDSVLSSIKIASSYMWNTLPHDIKSVNYSKNVFKSKVKSWLINQY